MPENIEHITPEFIDALIELNDDPQVRELIRQKEYADHERASIWADGNETGLAQGRLEGRLEGIKEGRQEGIKEGRQEGIKEGRQEGIKEGRQEGIKEGIDSLAKELIAIGMDKAAVQEAIRRMEANGH